MTYKLTPDQQRRGQISGGFKPRRSSGPVMHVEMRLPHNEVCPVCQARCVICGGNASHKRFRCLGPEKHFHRVDTVTRVSAKKSGVVAPAWYRGEFTPLERDPYALAKLAMEINR